MIGFTKKIQEYMLIKLFSLKNFPPSKNGAQGPLFVEDDDLSDVFDNVWIKLYDADWNEIPESITTEEGSMETNYHPVQLISDENSSAWRWTTLNIAKDFPHMTAVENNKEISFPVATAHWGTVKFVKIFKNKLAADGATDMIDLDFGAIAAGLIDPSITVDSDDMIRFAKGRIVISLNSTEEEEII